MKKNKELTLKDILKNPIYFEMMSHTDDWAGPNVFQWWKKFTI